MHLWLRTHIPVIALVVGYHSVCAYTPHSLPDLTPLAHSWAYKQALGCLTMDYGLSMLRLELDIPAVSIIHSEGMHCQAYAFKISVGHTPMNWKEGGIKKQ